MILMVPPQPDKAGDRGWAASLCMEGSFLPSVISNMDTSKIGERPSFLRPRQVRTVGHYSHPTSNHDVEGTRGRVGLARSRLHSGLIVPMPH